MKIPVDLPSIGTLKRICRSVAVLEAIIEPEWMYRYYSFYPEWDDGVEIFFMRNGSGDEMYVIFIAEGVFIKGFTHELPFDLYLKRLKELPQCFARFTNKPSFWDDSDGASFCLWRTNDDHDWHYTGYHIVMSNGIDTAEELLRILDGKAETYQAWATEYYERDIPFEAVLIVYQHKAITNALIRILNSKVEIKTIRSEVDKIGYP